MPNTPTGNPESWQGFSATQKTAAIVACGLSLARPAIATLVARNVARQERPTWRNAALYGVGCATDIADGGLARYFRAVTKFGTKLDPFADKVANNTVEVAVASRNGMLSIALWLMRLGRDAAVEAERRVVANSTNNTVSVAANGFGKATTLARNGTAALGVSPLHRRFPQAYRIAEVLTTGLTIYSGAVTIARLRRGAKAANRAAQPLGASRAPAHAGARSQR